MKYVYLDFNNYEEHYFEAYLNQLDQEGYTLSSIDFLTKKELSHKHYTYTVIQFEKKHNGQTKKQQIDQLIDEYTKKGYDYCGRLKKMYVFRVQNVSSHVKNINLEKVKNTSFNRLSYLIFVSILAIFVTALTLKQRSIDNLLTDGTIIIHYLPIFMAMIIVYRFVIKYMMIKKYDYPFSLKIYRRLHKIFYISCVLFLIISLSSLGLDYMQRRYVSHSEEKITLTSLDHQIKDYSSSYQKMHSVIMETSSSLEYKEDQFLYIKTYDFHFDNLCDDYFQLYKKNAAQTINKDIILISEQAKNDTFIIKKNSQLIYINASFSLETAYPSIIDAYK